MSFATELTAAMLLATTTNSNRADLTTAFTDFEAAVKAELVTGRGLSDTGPTMTGIREMILDLARYVGKEAADG